MQDEHQYHDIFNKYNPTEVTDRTATDREDYVTKHVSFYA